MMEQLDLFTSNNNTSSTYVEECYYSFGGKPIRVVSSDDGVMFVARDVCLALGYGNPSKAVSDHCKGVTKRYTLKTPGGPQEYRMINEGDVLRLICSSHLPTAERFERWVFDEVLPSIRKSGIYMTPEKAEDIISNPDLIIQLALQVKQERAAKLELQSRLEHSAVQIGILEPKAALADAFLNSVGDILIRNFAKHVKQALNMKSFGEKKMFQWLRSHGYLNADRYPSQRAVDHGWLHVVEGTHWNPVIGSQARHHTTKVTPKGQKYFYDCIRKEKDAGLL